MANGRRSGGGWPNILFDLSVTVSIAPPTMANGDPPLAVVGGAMSGRSDPSLVGAYNLLQLSYPIFSQNSRLFSSDVFRPLDSRLQLFPKIDFRRAGAEVWAS